VKKQGTVKIVLALMLFLALSLVVISPVLCNDSHHDCTGEECFVCLAVSSVRENYEHLWTWNQVISFAFVIFLSITAVFIVSDIDALITTPIKLKVKLSN
jgi:hypothetical protein